LKNLGTPQALLPPSRGPPQPIHCKTSQRRLWEIYYGQRRRTAVEKPKPSAFMPAPGYLVSSQRFPVSEAFYSSLTAVLHIQHDLSR